jgi:hypothetical protein
MIRQIGFRRLLPAAFTLVHFVLVLHAAPHRPHRLSGAESDSAFRAAEYQEGGAMPTEPIEPEPLTPMLKLAVVLNLPAFIAAAPLAVFLFHESELSLLYASAAFVPPLWYGIGRWLDGLLGYVGRSHFVPRVWSGLFSVVSASLLTVSVLTVTPLNHHRSIDTYWVGTALIVWSGLFLAICLSSFYRRPSN